LLICALAVLPGIGFLSWAIAVPVLLITFILGVVALSKGATLQGLAVMVASLIIAPVFLVLAPIVTTSVLAVKAAEAHRIASTAEATEAHEALTEEETQRAAELYSKLSKNHDPIEGITWLGSDADYKTATYLYIGSYDDGRTSLRWVLRYYGDDWKFIREYRIKCDNSTTLTLKPSDVKRQNSGGSVWETADEPATAHAAALNQILNSETATVRMDGTEGNKDLILTAEQIQGMRDMVLVYRHLGGQWPGK
jgi:hypothetical protein